MLSDMKRRPSWLNLRAVSDGPRTIRLRGAEIRDAFLEPGAHEAARLEVPLRESFSMGEEVSLEISFGAMVWPHMLARAMLAEQLYRATSILAGHPYHREG